MSIAGIVIVLSAVFVLLAGMIPYRVVHHDPGGIDQIEKNRKVSPR
jgi:hypothetical protein